MKKFLLYTFSFLTFVAEMPAQDTLSLALDEAIRIGVSRSVDAAVAKNEYTSSYWAYRTYKTELLPEVSIFGTLPEYSKSYNRIQHTNGEFGYVSSNYNQIDGGLSITQNIPWTGGRLTATTSLERLQQNGVNKFTQYKSAPFSLQFDQPIFGFNAIKWMQRIEPIKYKEAKQKLVSQQEEVANIAIGHYFNLLLGQANLEIAEQNLKNTEKLYNVAEAKHKIGQLSESDLMQMKISLLKAESSLTDARLSLDSRMFRLRSFLGYGENILLKPIIPEFVTNDIPVLSYSTVLSQSLENNSFTQNIQRRMVEASRDVSKAKADRWDIKLFAAFGMSGQEAAFPDVLNHRNWRDDQVVRVGIKIPILDWGKGKAKVKVAEADRELLQSKIEREKLEFNQDIFLRVQKFNNQPKLLKTAKEMDEIARKRYETSVEAFILGKMDILNLNDSQYSKDDARRNYIEQMHLLWSYYYQIRSLTLHDFITNQPITVSYDNP